MLKWKSQFEKLRSKVVEAMEKLMNTSLTYQQTAIYYNTCVLSSVYYGCVIMTLNEKEENELRRLHEAPMLNKLGLRSTFPRDMMHVSRDMLGLGLVLPTTMIAIQVIRMCFGNKRIKSNAARMIKVLEEQI